MIEIKDLLGRVQNILFGEEIKRQAILSSVLKVTGIEISLRDIKIKNSVVFLNIKPIFKNEVFIKKEKILEEFKKTLGEKSPIDIR